MHAKIHGYNNFGTCPSGLYRGVVLVKDGLIRQFHFTVLVK